MKYSPEMRQQMIEQLRGKTIEELEWTEEDGGYWTITTAEGFEFSFRFMAELVG